MGTGYPHFKVQVNFSRKRNRVDFRIEQLIREAGRVFHGDITIRMFEANHRITNKQKNRVC